MNDIEFIELGKALNQFGAEVVESAQLELGTTQMIGGRKVRRVASGALKQSLYHKVFVRKGKMRVDFGGAEYGLFIHEGVNGTRVNQGSPFSFKSAMVNVGAIERWIKVKPIRLRKTFINANGQKVSQFVEQNEKNLKSAAIAIAKSVARKGIAPLPFYRLAVDNVYPKWESKIAEAIEIDTLNFFK
jgi:hypothetical protein